MSRVLRVLAASAALLVGCGNPAEEETPIAPLVGEADVSTTTESTTTTLASTTMKVTTTLAPTTTTEAVTAPPTTEPPTTPPPPTEAPTTAAAAVYYANCDEARAAGAAPLHRGDPGYSSKLDRDDDGVACE